MTGACGWDMVKQHNFHQELSPLLGSNFPILSRLLPAAKAVIPVDDNPATLARLEAIMSDRVRPCPTCGHDPYICRAIGCGADSAPLLLT